MLTYPAAKVVKHVSLIEADELKILSHDPRMLLRSLFRAPATGSPQVLDKWKCWLSTEACGPEEVRQSLPQLARDEPRCGVPEEYTLPRIAADREPYRSFSWGSDDCLRIQYQRVRALRDSARNQLTSFLTTIPPEAVAERIPESLLDLAETARHQLLEQLLCEESDVGYRLSEQRHRVITKCR